MFESTDAQVIGLIGCDFSGSTVLSSILDGLPGVSSVGETHWIIDRHKGCRECRDEPCPVFSPQLLDDLRQLSDTERPLQWWLRIAQASGSSVLISSDKRPSHFARLGLPAAWIFVHKDPVAHVYSKARRLAQQRGEARIGDDILSQAVDWWVSNTQDRLTFLEEQGSRTGLLRNESLAVQPAKTAAAVAAFLGVPEDPSCVEYWTHDHHYVGGNFSVRHVARARSIDHTLRVDETYRTALTEDQQRAVSESEAVCRVVDRIAAGSSEHGWRTLG